MLRKLSIFGCLLFALSGCGQQSPKTNEGPEATQEIADDTITFVTINSPNTYFIDSDHAFSGLEYDLGKAFVKYVNEHKESARQGDKKLKFIVADSIEDVLATVINKKAHIAAADLSITKARQTLINFSDHYQNVQQQVVYNSTHIKNPARKISDIKENQIAIPEATSFSERLKQYQKDMPSLKWQELESVHSEGIIESLAHGEFEYTVADSHLVSKMQNFYPNLRVAFSLGKPDKIAWATSKEHNPELVAKINAFFKKIKKDGTLNNLVDRYHGNSKRLKRIDVSAFLTRIHTLLPKYKRLFQQAQEITGLDWRLIAALSYRESHWDTYNTSPTGVRGLMMLTNITAERMGVTDRLDPKQSVPAGAKYINIMIDSVPSRIAQPDRTYMALAAYNIGYAHVEDARVLAQRLGMNPDRWADVKKTLLLLTKPKYYRKAKYGYASGGAPIIFVESIRSYYNILTHFEDPYIPDSSNPYKIAIAR